MSLPLPSQPALPPNAPLALLRFIADSQGQFQKGLDQQTPVNQTYIVASNPAVLARLMRENENRSLNPSAYITPASVFNTLAVDFDGRNVSSEDHMSSALTSVDGVSLRTNQIPASELYKLNPIDADTAEAEEKIGQLIKSPSALERIMTASVEGPLLPSDSEPAVGGGEQKPNAQFQQAFQQFQNSPATNVPLVTYSSIASAYGTRKEMPPTITTPQLDKSKSLERNVTFQVSKLNSWDRSQNQATAKPTRSHSMTRQLSAGQEAVYSIASRSASLERSGLPPQGFVASRACCIEMNKQGVGGTVHASTTPSAGGVYGLKARGYRVGGAMAGGSLERNGAAQTLGGGNGQAISGGSLERNSDFSYNYYKSQLRQPDTEPFQEEIYDFGGANVRSCVSIALKKSMAKGMMPPEFEYVHPMPPPPYSPNAPLVQLHAHTPGKVLRSVQPIRQWTPQHTVGHSHLAQAPLSITHQQQAGTSPQEQPHNHFSQVPWM